MNLNYANYRVKLGEIVKEKRKKLRHSRESLARAIRDKGASMTHKTIERIEHANYSKDMSLSSIQLVCKELDFSINLKLGK